MKKLLAMALSGLAVGTSVHVASRFPAPKADAACCYFAAQENDINQPGQKAFIQWDPENRVEAFTVQPKFEGNAQDFGMVIPTPSQPKLDEMPRDFFKDLAIFTILLPLPEAIEIEPPNGGIGIGTSGGEEESAAVPRKDPGSYGVRVLESGVVGSLDYKVISAENSSGLYDWLKDCKYSYSGDEKTLDFYVTKKWLFTVMKIDSKQMKKKDDGSYTGEVTPTRFTFASSQCVYPLRITRISVKDATEALFYVQAPDEMDLAGDMTWMPSYRVMWLTYMQGCSITPEQETELTTWFRWLADRQDANSEFTTTKLEWAKRLDDRDAATLEDPVALWPQAGGAPLAQGDAVISLEAFLKEAGEYLNTRFARDPEYRNRQLKDLEKQYPAKKGDIVKVATPEKSPIGSRYVFYPKRDAPVEDVKGVSRLKGHLQKGRWLTKFRRTIQQIEMTDDLILVPVVKEREQEYVRIMPTSPP